MKILIKQNDQISGPFTSEELRHQIYSGSLNRETVACVEGTDLWRPIQELLRSEPPVLSKSPHPVIDDISTLFDPKEKTALTWLYIMSIPAWIAIIALVAASYGGILIWVLFFWVFRLFAEAMFLAHLKTNAVRVSANQLPEIHRAVSTNCERLNIQVPDVYVMQANSWNAFAAKFLSRRIVVLLSGAVDSILLKGDQDQLNWVIGHELGHHWAGHLGWKQKVASLGGWFFWIKLWHSRRRELTCDRVGLYCSGSLRSSQIALANLTAGAQLANKVQPEAAIAQLRQHEKEFFVRYKTFYSSYPSLLARLDHLDKAGNEFGIRQ